MKLETYQVSKQHIQTANEPRNRCSMSLAFWEMQIKTLTRYLYIPASINKKTDVIKCWQGQGWLFIKSNIHSPHKKTVIPLLAINPRVRKAHVLQDTQA